MRTRTAAAAALLAVATLAAASTAPARPEPPAPHAAVAATTPDLIDPAAETRDLMMRAARTRRAPAPPPTATAAPPPAAPATKTPRRTLRKAAAKPTAPAPRQRRTRPAVTAAAPTDGSRAAVVTAFALAQVGKPYIWASAGPRGYDCSGLVLASYARVGISLPHQSGSIAGRGQSVPRGQWAPGDVLVWTGHVALYLGGGRMVHAPGPGRRITVASVYGSPSARRLL